MHDALMRVCFFFKQMTRFWGLTDIEDKKVGFLDLKSIWPLKKNGKNLAQFFLCVVSVLSVKNAPFDMEARSIARIIEQLYRGCGSDISEKKVARKLRFRTRSKVAARGNFDCRHTSLSLSTHMFQDHHFRKFLFSLDLNAASLAKYLDVSPIFCLPRIDSHVSKCTQTLPKYRWLEPTFDQKYAAIFKDHFLTFFVINEAGQEFDQVSISKPWQMGQDCSLGALCVHNALVCAADYLAPSRDLTFFLTLWNILGGSWQWSVSILVGLFYCSCLKIAQNHIPVTLLWERNSCGFKRQMSDIRIMTVMASPASSSRQ